MSEEISLWRTVLIDFWCSLLSELLYLWDLLFRLNKLGEKYSFPILQVFTNGKKKISISFLLREKDGRNVSLMSLSCHLAPPPPWRVTYLMGKFGKWTEHAQFSHTAPLIWSLPVCRTYTVFTTPQEGIRDMWYIFTIISIWKFHKNINTFILFSLINICKSTAFMPESWMI